LVFAEQKNLFVFIRALVANKEMAEQLQFFSLVFDE